MHSSEIAVRQQGKLSASGFGGAQIDESWIFWIGFPNLGGHARISLEAATGRQGRYLHHYLAPVIEVTLAYEECFVVRSDMNDFACDRNLRSYFLVVSLADAGSRRQGGRHAHTDHKDRRRKFGMHLKLPMPSCLHDRLPIQRHVGRE